MSTAPNVDMTDHSPNENSPSVDDADTTQHSTGEFVTLLTQKISPEHHHVTRLSEWYPTFRKCTMRSVILPLPDDFVSYIQHDGPLILPKCPDQMTLQPSDPRFTAPRDPYAESSDDDDDSGEWTTTDTNNSQALPNSANEEDPSATSFCFPDFERQIKESVAALGGRAFSRTDWTSPNDVRCLLCCFHFSLSVVCRLFNVVCVCMYDRLDGYVDLSK